MGTHILDAVLVELVRLSFEKEVCRGWLMQVDKGRKGGRVSRTGEAMANPAVALAMCGTLECSRVDDHDRLSQRHDGVDDLLPSHRHQRGHTFRCQ